MISGLKELDNSYIFARSILKQLKYLMERCKPLSLYKGIVTRSDMDSALLAGLASGDPMGSHPRNLPGQCLSLIDPNATEF
jgi:hypothetical protein